MEKLPKKESGINRIVGASAEEESEMLNYFKGRLEQLPDEKARAIEYQKSPELRELLSDAITRLKDFLERYGIGAVDITPDNIFIIDPSKLDQNQKTEWERAIDSKTGARYFPGTQKIVVYADMAKLDPAHFVEIVAHELIHLNSFASYQKTAEQSGLTDLKPRRMGLNITSEGAKTDYFRYANEAVTEELASRFCDYFFPLSDALKDVASEKEAYIKKYIPSEKQELARHDVLSIKTTKDGAGQFRTIIASHAYEQERLELNKIIRELYERNRDKFSSREEVFNLFADAMLKGNLLPLARLVEKSYSKGMFRHFGEAGAEKNEGEAK